MIDTHTHISLCTSSPEDMLKKANEFGVDKMINIGLDLDSSKSCAELYAKYPTIFPTLGLHPLYVNHIPNKRDVISLLKDYPFKAIGEIGLDYFREGPDKVSQRRAFEMMLEVAGEHNMPVVIHNRHADDDMIDVFKSFPSILKVFHCYSTSPAFAEAQLDINPYTMFSFTGLITYSKKGKIIQTLKRLPMSHIMIETDCPYLTPEPHRGTDNEPAYVSYIAKRVSELKGIPLEEVDRQTTENAIRFFRL